MTLRQLSALLETAALVVVFLAFVLYYAWVGPRALSKGSRQ